MPRDVRARVVAAFLWFMAVPATHRQDTVANLGMTLAEHGVDPAAGQLPAAHAASCPTARAGRGVIGLTFVFDTAAFLGGSIMGGQFFQRPLAPTVSPKKSIEGLIIATLVTAVVSVALVTTFVNPFEDMRIEALMLGLVVAARGHLRRPGGVPVKRDMGQGHGQLLPGHGGVLDRIDSLLFVAPAAFLFFRIVLRLSGSPAGCAGTGVRLTA